MDVAVEDVEPGSNKNLNFHCPGRLVYLYLYLNKICMYVLCKEVALEVLPMERGNHLAKWTHFPIPCGQNQLAAHRRPRTTANQRVPRQTLL